MSKPCASRSVANARQMLTCLAFGLVAPAALAAGDGRAASPAGVSTGACEVLASGQLGSNEYIASYQGACKDGQANGQGRAEWRLRYAPNAAPVVWEGRFHQGVYLAESAVKGARRIDRTRVLLDLGTFQSAGQSGRMWVESRVDGKLPAQACQPISVQISTAGSLADDEVAKQWLHSAYQRWSAVCQQANANPSTKSASGRLLRVQLREDDAWAPDAYGNLPDSTVQAVTSVTTGAGPVAWNQYTNRAAQQRTNAAHQQQATASMQANQERLRNYARATGATQYVELSALEQNPFRFGQGVVLVGLQLVEARTPTEAVVRPARRVSSDWTRALVQGAIAPWDNQGRIVAVRIQGRSTDKHTRDALILEMVDSKRCEAIDCEDYLFMPGRRWLREEAL